jgi:hypothetical protein
VLEVRSDTKFQLLPLFNIVELLLGLIRKLEGASSRVEEEEAKFSMLVVVFGVVL